VYGVGFPTGRNNGAQTPVLSFILNNGGHLVSPDLKTVMFDSQEVREAYQLLKELAQYLPPGTGTWANPQQVDAIVHGTIANGHYFGRVFQNLSQQNAALIGKVSNTLIPYNKQTTVNNANWGAHCIFKTATNPQGAKELLRFAVKKDQEFSLKPQAEIKYKLLDVQTDKAIIINTQKPNEKIGIGPVKS